MFIDRVFEFIELLHTFGNFGGVPATKFKSVHERQRSTHSISVSRSQMQPAHVTAKDGSMCTDLVQGQGQWQGQGHVGSYGDILILPITCCISFFHLSQHINQIILVSSYNMTIGISVKKRKNCNNNIRSLV
jgi:hypothetical protein